MNDNLDKAINELKQSILELPEVKYIIKILDKLEAYLDRKIKK